MASLTPGISVFVSLRFNKAAPVGVLESLNAQVVRDKGTVIGPQKGSDFTARFGLVTTALQYLRWMHAHLRREEDCSAAVGIECGEHDSSSKCAALDRAVELSTFAHFDQNLAGRAAREIARQALPTGYLVVQLGETNLGNSISKDQIFQISISGFPETFPRLVILDDVTTNIPELSKPFIGREKEDREIRKRLQESRVVTIVGPPGVGKTSLAHWLTLDLADVYRDGTWRVDLGRVPKGGNVAVAIAADLRLSIQNHSAMERVMVEFATLDGLIWLDNCEHLLHECAEVIQPVLANCQKVKFLLTSRGPLELPGESVCFLAPFETPKSNADPEESEAVRLFINRAKAAKPGFKVDAHSLQTIASICTEVSGLPFAIELVAAQAANYGLDDLFDNLSKRLNTPVPGGRYKTLDSALDWSYSMLSAKEQKFFRALGVTVGPINRALAQAVGAAKSDGEAILQKLVSASLIQESSQRGIKSYRLLEPVRHFANDLLKKHGELDTTLARFVKACVEWLVALEAEKFPNLVWLTHVRQDYSNLIAALEIVLESTKGGKDALTMCALMYDLWILDGPYDVAHSYYERALATGKATPVACNADIYGWAGLFAGYAGKYEQSEAAFNKAVEMHRKSGNKEREAIVYLNMAIHLRNATKLDAAVEVTRRALEIEIPNDPLLPTKLGAHAWTLAQRGNFEESRIYLDRAIAASPDDLDVWVRATQEAQLYHHAIIGNRTSEAETHLANCLALYRETGHVQGILVTIEDAGILALRLGNVDRAARLIGGTERYFVTVGIGRSPIELRKQKEAVAGIGDALGNDAAEERFKEGAMMSIEELYDYARSGCG
jgi:predicted ATPase